MIDKRPGDCFSRCLCELSGEPYRSSQWPNLPNGTMRSWLLYQEELKDFLARHGWVLIVVDLLVDGKQDYFLPKVDTVHLVGGKRADGVGHAVIKNGDELVFDPHPSAEGLAEEEDWWFLVPVDPAKYFNLG